MRNPVAFIQRIASGKVLLAIAIPTIIVYLTMLSYTIPKVEQHASGMKVLDLLPTGYSFSYAIELLDALGKKGRDAYKYQQLPLDFIYPGLFAVSGCLLLSLIFIKTQNSNSRLLYLYFIPVAAGVFDYLENISIFYMLCSYPNVTETLVTFASVMTIFKSTLTMVFFLLLLLGVVLLLKRKLGSRY